MTRADDLENQISAPIRRQRAITTRSVAIGLLGVVLLSALTPASNLVLNNSPLTAGAMPVAAMFLLVVLLLINAPLWRYRPHRALGCGELAVVLVMLLVASAVPGRGLMQMWPAELIGVRYWAETNGEPIHRRVLDTLALPWWFFPASQPGADPVVQWFYTRIPDSAPDGAPLTAARAWVSPVVGWSIFFGAMASAVVGLGVLAARQWIVNERIAFPIATVQLALLQEPGSGRWFNQTMRSTPFLVGVAAIVLLRVLDIGNTYFPKHIPAIPMGFNLRAIFADPPLAYIDQRLTLQTIYPLVAALSFFCATRISLSLWACVLLSEIPSTLMQASGGEGLARQATSINLGALLAFAAMILYSGRHFYLKVLRTLVLPLRRGDTDVRFIVHYRTAGWMALGGAMLAIGWLAYAGMPVLPAALLVLGLLLIWMVMANVIAHSGLLMANTLAVPHACMAWGFNNPGGLSALSAADVKTQFFAQAVGGMWAYNGDHLSAHLTHSGKLVEQQAPETVTEKRPGRQLVVLIGLALVVAFVVSLGSTLVVEYRHLVTLDSKYSQPLNAEVIDGQPKWALNHTTATLNGSVAKAPGPDLWYAGGGATLTGLLAFLQLRYSGWPIHPIGLLMMHSFAVRRIWFSIFLGWAAKTIVLRLGGVPLYRTGTQLFTGFVVGEICCAAGIVVLSVVLQCFGVEHYVINTLPVSQY